MREKLYLNVESAFNFSNVKCVYGYYFYVTLQFFDRVFTVSFGSEKAANDVKEKLSEMKCSDGTSLKVQYKFK